MRIATINVNGIRAAWRKGMADWLTQTDADIVTLQEVRAPDAVVREVLAETGYHVAHTESV
ncbi:MAG TPA: endonuclease/exonuclease/phosphatase family protein, partial [Aeromicrobium sp.]|nr:endonuclease/exonuclease/phosphatase family protein [Aeromicrobium sp.]